MQRWTKSVRPWCNVAKSTCCPFLAVVKITSFPYRFKCCIINEDKRSKVFLADQLRFQLDQSIAHPKLSIDRQSDRLNNWVGQIVDQLDRRIRIGKAGMFRITFVE